MDILTTRGEIHVYVRKEKYQRQSDSRDLDDDDSDSDLRFLHCQFHFIQQQTRPSGQSAGRCGFPAYPLSLIHI